MANNCSNCGTCTDKCKCIPKGVTTPSYCITDKPSCPEPDPCSETIDSNCVIYNGEDCTLLEFQAGNTMQTFVNKVCDYLAQAPCCYITSLTNAELKDLIDAGDISSAFYYMVTDPINAESVIVQGITSNSVTLHGAGIFLNADYQAVGDYSSLTGTITNIGIWSSVSQTVTPNNVVIWNNKHYRNKTGNWGSAPSTDSINWEELAKIVTTGFIQEIDFVKYDVDANLVIYRADKRGNEVEHYVAQTNNSIVDFQWGRDQVKGNKVFGESYMKCTNSYSQFLGNQIHKGYIIDSTNSTGSLSSYKYNKIINGSIGVAVNTSDILSNTLLEGGSISVQNVLATIEKNTIGANGSIISAGNTTAFYIKNSIINDVITYSFITQNQDKKVINTGYSNFETTIAAAATLTVSDPQFGIVYLTGTQTVDKITNISKTRSTRFIPQAGSTVSFQHTTIATVTNTGELVCDAPSSLNVVVGRTVGSDIIEYQQFESSGNFVNLRINLVKLA